MTDKDCPTKKISSFSQQNASLSDPPHPPGDNCWAFPLVPAGSQATKLSTTTLDDGAPPHFWSTARASLPAIAGRQAKMFWPKVDTVLKNPDIYIIFILLIHSIIRGIHSMISPDDAMGWQKFGF